MTSPLRTYSRKDVREEVRVLQRLGWTYTGKNGAGHHEFEHPARETCVTLADTPSSPTWRRGHRRQLAEKMGLNVWQLERLIAGQPTTKRPGRQRTRAPRKPGPRALHLLPPVEPEPDPPSPPPVVAARFEPTDGITPAREALWARNENEVAREKARERLHPTYPWRAA